MNNPFALFDLPVAFDLDEHLLKARYLALQKQYHPDNFAHASAEIQRQAMQKSTEINDAWQTLSQPILRAECMLDLAQYQPDNASTTHHDVDFLMQQMAWREQLDDVENSGDEKALKNLERQVKSTQQHTLTLLQQDLETGNWQQAYIAIQRLQFIQKMQTELDRVDEKFCDEQCSL